MACSNAFSFFTCLLFTIIWFICGIYIFTNGFLLTRREIELKSSCQNESLNESSNFTNTCWTVPSLNSTYQKVVLVVIDALRYDFAFYQRHKTSNQIPYLNKLSIFKNLADKHGCNSVRLFKFRADAPTTTMQRLKGMTTGSFPTFIDVRNNFDSSEISEDNFVDQLLKSANSNITFLGDDTWEKLFPGRFATSYSFPSFDVKDLHLVDNGILQHLLPELKKRNWKLLIAHFLGVDHCGHRYGPLHPEMAAKLSQMNSMLQSVAETMEHDDLLLVMGDHGMTQTGDHGGETTEEIDSALFAFSKSGKFSETKDLEPENCAAGTVHQIDIVPTLSLLFGTPIPFSNLGSLIVDFIPDESPSLLHEALLVNAKQIEMYLKEYGNRYGKFTSPTFQQLLNSLELQNRTKDPNLILQLLHSLRQQCKNVWANFNEKLMVLGSCLFCTMCMMLYYSEFNVVLLTLFSLIFFVAYLLIPANYQNLVMLFCLSALLFHVLRCFKKLEMIFIVLICTFFPLLYTSNSFVINEDVIVMFLYSSAVTFLVLDTLQRTYCDLPHNKVLKTKRINRRTILFLRQLFQFCFQKPLGKFFILLLTFLFSVRIAFLFRVCRPEQHWCFQTQDAVSSSDAISSSLKGGVYYVDSILNFSDPWKRFFVCGSSLITVLIILTARLKREGNLRRPYSAAVVCNKLLWGAVLCIILNWQLHTVTYEKILDELPDFFVVLLPRCAYVFLLLSCFWWIVSPLTVHILYQDKYGRYRDEIALSNDEVVSFYFNQLKHQFSGNFPDHQRNSGIGTPAAFGMYTMLSAALIGFGSVIIMFGAMLLEEKYAPVFLLFVLSTGVLLEVLSAVRHRCSPNSLYVSLDVVGIWMLSSSFWWFATGHQNSLSSIPWNAAFVGFTGNHPTIIIPALMVVVNIFISPILHTVFLPLLLLWPLTRGSWFSKSSSKLSDSDKRTAITSEFEFLRSSLFWPALSDLFYKNILFHSLKVLGCICAAFIHRRHLMVWQIFAPRFVYEVVNFLVVCIMTLLVFLFMIMFKRSVDSWTKKQNFDFSLGK